MNAARAGTAAVATLFVAHLIGVASSLDNPMALRTAHNLAGWAGALFGVFGTVIAARTFEKGDYLRRVWSLLALAAGFLLVNTALRTYWAYFEPDRSLDQSAIAPLRMVAVIGSNTVQTFALVLLTLTYRASGLKPPLSWQGALVWAAAAAGALGFGAPQLLKDFGGPLGYAAVTSIVSTLGDMATVILVAPMVRIAYWMRGGRLARVWWALAVSGSIWLIYDARGWLAGVLPGDAADNDELIRVSRSVALALVGLAGWLQKDAVERAEVAPVRVEQRA